ncbi:aminotransferase class I/II-fold pyridoxal phosphate-dependent enzyme [Vulgatibacter sp.]|uniref:aminotransferase class I/II-fold pyridoxal phosphate-dependent enzyme n=1 Tax=Vulgatibacter sp. TaxID=1971226 RepID=UPI0035616A23
MTTYPASARAAYEKLHRLELALGDPASRPAALEELRALADLARDQPEGAPLRLAVVEAAVGTAQERLELFLLPTIFAPEDWAYTFLEGLLKVPIDEYDGKSLVEVGTGSGWIPIALSKFTRLSRIVGVDLNPQAPAVATCNAWLNCDADQIARLSFGVSDLLKGLPADARWDFVVGCIPQVLRTEGIDEPKGEEEALYDLSNYCAIQNVYEDHFGLGLIARLLDECPEILAPGGRLLLNLAGRPGRGIIERMFSRRGFRTEVLVARRVKQAADTDIRPLVALEQRTQREFEFFVHQHSAEPLRAETALGWLQAGHPIWHEVAVWSAQPMLPRETLLLRRALQDLGAGYLLDELDLGAGSQEQLDFVAHLAERLASNPVIPYAHEAGDPSFRSLIARYLARFFDLRLDEREIFVAPEREQAVHSLLLSTCDPGDGVLISRNVHGTYAKALEKAGVRATVTNNTLREIRRLLSAFDVKVAILSVEPSERSNLSALREIVDEAAARGILVILDESPFFHITSGVEPHTLFEFLAREPHRPNLVVLYGLIKNAVFPDFELTLLLPVPAQLHADLEVAAEVTYSRIATPVQWFYERLFAELLAFRISFAAAENPGPRREPVRELPRSVRIARIASFPAFAPKVFQEDDPELVRLDYGENEAPVPQPLAEGLVAAAAVPPSAAPVHGLEEAIAAFLLETRGVRYDREEIVVGQGVWPLIHDFAWALGKQLGRAPRLYVATPCYGVLAPTLEAAGAVVEQGPLAALYERRGGSAPDAVVISQPSNPQGCYLSREELVALAAWAAEHRCRIVSDEIFGLVNLTHTAAETVRSPVTLEQAVPGTSGLTVVLGGLSKEFAAGGMRVGWLATHDADLASLVREAALGTLQLVAARTGSHLYAAFGRTAAGRLVHPRRHRALREHLGSMRRDLAKKRARIAGALGLEGGSDEAGGLFLAPVVRAWMGRSIDGEALTPENLPRKLYEHTHVVVNGGPWCGDPERIRLVFSIPEEKLERAAERLAAFAKSLEG